MDFQGRAAITSIASYGGTFAWSYSVSDSGLNYALLGPKAGHASEHVHVRALFSYLWLPS